MYLQDWELKELRRIQGGGEHRRVLSWTKCARLQRRGLLTINPYFNRWEGSVTITELGASVVDQAKAEVPA